MKINRLVASLLFLALPLLPIGAIAVEEKAVPLLSVTAKDGRIDIEAKDASARDLLQEVGKKTGIKLEISDGVKDKKVTLSVNALPVFSLGTVLKQMALANYAVVYDIDLKALVVYVLPDGADISHILKGKHVVRQADFPNPDHAVSIKGKTIETVRKGSDGTTIRYVKDEILLRFHRGVEKAEIDEILKRHNLEAVGDAALSKIGYLKARITDGRDVLEVIKEVRQEYKVKVPEPNYVLGTLTTTATDPLYSEQWYVQDTNFDKAWEVAKSTEKVTVAVIDSGVDSTHPDIAGKILPGYDFVNSDADASDDHGHGTFVTGIIAANSNYIGIIGLYDNARILPVKVIDANGVGTYEDVAKGIIFSADSGARVINLSIGGYAFSHLLSDAVDYALEKGCILVAAGGNDGIEQEVYPAAYPEVIGVAALGYNGQIWSESNSGRHVDIAAPGVDVLSLGNYRGYSFASGTSVSVPIVSALAGLLTIERQNLSSTAIQRLLTQSSRDLGRDGYDTIYGYGEVNAESALITETFPSHDLSLRKLEIEPLAFESNKEIFLVAEISNIGSYPSEICDVEFFQLEGSDKKLLGKIENIEIRDKGRVVYKFIPNMIENKDYRFQAEISLTNDCNPNNNSNITETFTALIMDGLYVLYKVEVPVHQWIALQAYEKLPSGNLKTEISNKSYIAPESYVCPNNRTIYDFSPCIPPTWSSSGENAPDLNLYPLTEGTWEEDFSHYSITNSLDNSWCRHFWKPSGGYNNGLGPFKDLTQGCSLTDRMDSALTQADRWWQQAIEKYLNINVTDEKYAYYYLGRVAHLLMDMSVPAHVNDDPHPPWNGDSYEKFTANATDGWDSGNYRRIDYQSATTDILSPVDSAYWTPGYDKKLTYIFLKLAAKAAEYDSDDVNGTTSKCDPNMTNNGICNFWRRYNVLNGSKSGVSKVEQTDFWGSVKKTMKRHYDYELDRLSDSLLFIKYHDSFVNSVGITDKVRVTYTDDSNDTYLDLEDGSNDPYLLFPRFGIPTTILEDIHQVELQSRAVGSVAALYQLLMPLQKGSVPNDHLSTD